MKDLPEIKKRNGGHCFWLEGHPFIMLAAETHNSACTSREYMQQVWSKVKELNCNTLLAPVYWEWIEPQENQFDFDLAEQLIIEARKNRMKLVLLWFGSWKNGLSTYAPTWVKTDGKRFPRTEDEHGRRTKILSMFGSEVLAAEQNAFRNFMQYIKVFDAEEQTVLAVQIENEVGILGAARDFSVGAEAEYKKDIPNSLAKHIKNCSLCGTEAEDSEGMETVKNGESSKAFLSEADTNRIGGSWEKVFKEKAEEVFMAWHYAGYINELTKCGKECYALPMFTNVWLKSHALEKAGVYPSGGPVPEMLDIWKLGAPSLDILAPDIYTFDFAGVADSYARADNPLFVPETRRDKWAAANLYLAVGRYHTLCYSPFGAESIGEDHSFITGRIHTDSKDKNVSSPVVKEYLAQSYRLLGNMLPVITGHYGDGKMTGFVQGCGEKEKQLELGGCRLTIQFYHSVNDDDEFLPAAGIIIQAGEYEWIFAGYGYRACLDAAESGKQLDFLALEKGHYDEKANWIKDMDLNGDEQQVQMEEKPTAVRAWYYEF